MRRRRPISEARLLACFAGKHWWARFKRRDVLGATPSRVVFVVRCRSCGWHTSAVAMREERVIILTGVKP